MTPEIYRQASELFERLRRLPAGDLTPALEAACGGHAELRAQVMRLIEADRNAQRSFLEGRAVEDAAMLLAPLPPLTPETPALPADGIVIGNYRLGKQIGAGGMGVVYEGLDLHLERRVAVKILPVTAAAEGAERIRRFQREARAASTLNHPNIVSIFDADFAQGYHYIAMEFVEGKTLRQLAGPPSPLLDSQTILDWIGQTASALSAAHAAGIVHRDIKPENIMVRPDGFVKVLDFGLAKLREPPSNAASEPDFPTRPGNLAGTIQYLSPEQVLGEPAGPRSDLFSLGVVAYELATRVRPFDGPTDGAVFNAILHRVPPLPSAIRPSLGAGLDGLIIQALEKDPELRFQTAGDLRSSCRRITRDHIVRSAEVSSAPLSVVAHPTAPALPPATRTGRAGSVAKLAIRLAFLILLLVCAWLYIALHSRNRLESAPNSTQASLLTALPGYQIHPSLSPDGRKLAFVWNGNSDNYDIYVKAIDNEETPRRLTSNEAEDLNPAWSPDSSQIAFLRVSPNRKEIFVIPAEGGPERKIAEITPLAVPWTQEASTMRRTAGPAWSPDGQTLAVTDRCEAQGSSDCIYLLSLDGSRQRITSGAALGDYSPTFSPDGKQIAFLRTVADIGIADIYTQAVNEKSARRLTSDNKHAVALAWSVNHRIYFISNRTGPILPWSITDTGGEARLVAGMAGEVFFLSAAARVNEIAYAQSYRNTNIWRTNLTARGAPSELLIGSSRVNHSPQYSADGSRIAFISDRSGGPEVWVAKSDGSEQRRLTISASVRSIGSPNWSPDGKQLVYDSVLSGRSEIYLMNVDGTNQRQFTTDPWEDMMPTWSADGRFIYYVARRNGRLSLWKESVDGGGNPIHIVDDVFSDGLESPDGQRVFFSRSTPGIWEAPSNGGAVRLIPELAGVVDSRHCFVDRTGIYFLAHELPPWEIRHFDFATHRVSSVTRIFRTLEFYTRSLSVSPDGKWMLHVQVDQIGSEIAMLSNPQ